MFPGYRVLQLVCIYNLCYMLFVICYLYYYYYYLKRVSGLSRG